MPYKVMTDTYPAEGRDGGIIVLEGDGARAEVWPACGFNCFRWRVSRGGQLLEVLYADPALFRGGR
ncbi:MAG TPA: hypothetical protein VFW33_10815, partial [Gemmataceae bacterium]|nr:hypothetical protein [Gemmataceae bacterium]